MSSASNTKGATQLPLIRNPDGTMSLSNPFDSTKQPIDLSKIEFGSDECRALFGINQSLDQPITPLNHGSFGSTPLTVLGYHHALATQVESNCDRWFRIDSYQANRLAMKSIVQSINQSTNLALNVHEEDCVFVNNATSGVNAVLNSVLESLTQADRSINQPIECMTPHLTYGACKYALQSSCRKYGAKYVELFVPLPSTNESIYQSVIDVLDSSPNIKLVLLDAITSPTAMLFPWRELAVECRKRGIFCLIDGAHVIGQAGASTNQSIGDSECDVFVSNLHKWNFAPKGTAMMWINPKCTLRAALHPVIVSWNWQNQSILERFWGQGTRDDTAYVASHAGAMFYSAVGYDRVYEYNKQLADWGVNYLCEKWNVPSYDLVSREQSAPFMRVVKLPFDVPQSIKDLGKEAVRKLGDRLCEFCMNKFNLVIAGLTFNETLYCRFSAQVYVTRKDFEHLASVMLSINQSPELLQELTEYSMTK